LLSVGSRKEHDYIFRNINEWFWTGGQIDGTNQKRGEKDGKTPTWTWSDGTTWDEEYKNWFYKQPSKKGAEMCRGVQIFSTLIMSHCDRLKKFICEKEASDFSSGNSGLISLSTIVSGFPAFYTVTSPLKNHKWLLGAVSNKVTGCPAGWKSMFDSCYQWFYTAVKTWEDAEVHCQQLGGHLASLHTKEENEFIGKTTKGTVWIGGKKVGSEWTWSDGTPWDFGSVQSVPFPYGGDCSTTFAGSASGFDCKGKRLYICKKKKS